MKPRTGIKSGVKLPYLNPMVGKIMVMVEKVACKWRLSPGSPTQCRYK
jgi:hypothetical protein